MTKTGLQTVNCLTSTDTQTGNGFHTAFIVTCVIVSIDITWCLPSKVV